MFMVNFDLGKLSRQIISYYIMCYVYTDHGLSVGMLLTWFPFLYFEMTFRFNHVPQYLLNISRPFAAHWYVNCASVYLFFCVSLCG